MQKENIHLTHYIYIRKRRNTFSKCIKKLKRQFTCDKLSTGVYWLIRCNYKMLLLYIKLRFGTCRVPICETTFFLKKSKPYFMTWLDQNTLFFLLMEFICYLTDTRMFNFFNILWMNLYFILTREINTCNFLTRKNRSKIYSPNFIQRQ